MMLPKLALGNVKKSVRDYAIYFITIAFGVCIFYIFNSIESQQVMMDVTPGQQSALKLLSNFMNVFSVFISAALCFLIIYANSFLIKRRKKEFGIYLILGMEKGAISLVLVMETVLVGVAGLVAGLVLGLFVSQGMGLITARLLNSALSTYHFVFSSEAAIQTVIYFGLTFLLTLVFNVVTINKQKLIDLLNSARKNEQFTPPRFARSIALFIFALILLGITYYLVGLDLFFSNMAVFLSAVVLAVSGTFLFFFSLSGFFLRLIQQRKSLYLRNLNMFSLRQIASKIHTNYVSMTFVCLMLALAICTLSSGTGVAGSITKMQQANAPFDATVTFQQDAGKEEISFVPYERLDIEEMARKEGIDISAFAEKWVAISYYRSPVNLRATTPQGEVIEIPTKIMKLSDYNAVLAMQGEQPITLEAGTYALHANLPSDTWNKELIDFLQNKPTLDLGTATLVADSSRLLTAMDQTMQTRVERVEVIVPDEYVEKDGNLLLPAIQTLLNINYRGDASDVHIYDTLLDEVFKGRAVLSSDGIDLGSIPATRTDVLQVGNSAVTIVAYIALYLGMVFLLASAALLAIAQLSEASDNISRYRMLAKIGTDSKMLHGALFGQIAIYFGVPMFLAVIHSIVGISALSVIFAAVRDEDILGGSLIAALVIIAVYGGYFLATYIGSKGILNREAINQLTRD
ncbi:MAG: FtsX-like permease family protein [Coriobacteriales bacterium]|jgi:putative ABC transport system permease protein|nr:FtsX-like permease family protein [Coriobacteriales bacterium]